jgi:uncharacterized RDD family membrane protein YckC
MENEQVEYAGFWMRFVAYFIDSIIIGFIEFLVVLPLLGLMGYNVAFLSTLSEIENADPELLIPIIASAVSGIALSALLITWFYYALMHSSARQATVGKMALSLKVTDVNGDRLTFARASLRYFSKILSGMFMMIGYIMAGFTAKKQALHDMIANTYVVRN